MACKTESAEVACEYHNTQSRCSNGPLLFVVKKSQSAEVGT